MTVPKTAHHFFNFRTLAQSLTSVRHIGKEKLPYLLCMHFTALEFGFLTPAEKLIPISVRGQLSYAVGNARALGLA
jgi:hypothetical protein